jgi:exosortase
MPKPRLTQLKTMLPSTPVLLCWLGLIVALVWAYWLALDRLVITWWEDEDYQHGFFVPVFSLVLLWFRRDMVDPFPDRGSLWGLAFFGLWAVMRWVTARFFYIHFDMFSVLPFLAGVAVFLGGWRALRWAWPSIAFLVFMIPLPGFLAGQLRYPLQQIATRISVFLIETLGVPADVQGEHSNVISLTNGQLNVVEACSGLRMLMLFVAICVGAAFLIRRAPWEKVVIVLSAIPIAVFANVMRISITAVLYELARKWPNLIDTQAADHFFHDWAGYFMMPLALLVLWGEVTLLKMLFLEPPTERPLVLGPSLAAGLRTAASQAGKTQQTKTANTSTQQTQTQQTKPQQTEGQQATVTPARPDENHDA